MLGMSMLMGARGIGAMLGPLLSAPWAGHNQRRLRIAILVAFLAESLGYTALGWITSLWTACIWIILAHCGGSVIWVFSTTLLQLNTDDRFRGRVFAADLSLSMFTLAIGAYLAGRFMDWGVSARMVASAAGMLMLLPAALWARSEVLTVRSRTKEASI
jgi:MFS family permease